MRANHRSTLFYIALSCAALHTNYGYADYIGGYPSTGLKDIGVERIHDNGTLSAINYENSIPSSISSNIETYADAVAVSPDLKKTYNFVNTLGFSNYIIVSDAKTGQYLANDTIALGSFPPIQPYIEQAKQPLVTASNELFVISGIFPAIQSNPNALQIQHFDLPTKSFVESIAPSPLQKIDDIAFRASGLQAGLSDELYYSTPSGVFVEKRPAPSFVSEAFGSIAAPLIPGVDGNIAIGPNNLLYVRNFANGDVQRYSLTGQFIDTLISHTSYSDLGTIQFGVDGNLHAYQGNLSTSINPTSHILTFDPLTGSLLSSTPNTYLFPGRVTFVPVPEPTSVLLVSVLLCFTAIGGRAKR